MEITFDALSHLKKCSEKQISALFFCSKIKNAGKQNVPRKTEEALS